MREREAEGRAGCGQGRDRVAGGQNPGAEGMKNRSSLHQIGEGILVLHVSAVQQQERPAPSTSLPQ